VAHGGRAGDGAVPPASSTEVQTLHALRAATEAITSTKRLDDLFEAVGEHVSSIVPYHSLRLFLFDEATQELYPAALSTTREDYREVDLAMPQLRLKLGQGVTGMVATTRTGEVVYDLSTHPHVYYPPGVAAIDEESYIGVPLEFRDELVGVLTLSKYGQAEFDEHELGLIEVLAVPIAASLAHARAEDAEQRAREQEARLRRLHGSFVGNISHELRTPLTLSLGAYKALLKSQLARDCEDVILSGMRNTGRLLYLVNELLELAKFDSGHASPKKQCIDLAGLIRDVAANFSSRLRPEVTCESPKSSVWKKSQPSSSSTSANPARARVMSTYSK
jgi:signal transduction histidine kinase